MYIAVDFDGTIVTHDYPEVGKPIDNCIETLKKLVSNGHKIILFTMRTGDKLQDAVNYLKEEGITLEGINENPAQAKWSSSRKVYAHIYIDDAALGCPLIEQPDISPRPFVNWFAIEYLLRQKNLI